MKDRTKAKLKVLALAEKRERPILVGEVSLLLGEYCRLEDAERIVYELVAEGKLRPVTEAESKKYDVKWGFMWCRQGK